MGLSVTLLICTSGRAAQLDRCLKAITSGGELPRQLVVVNGEDGQTPAVVERHASAFEETVLVTHPNRNLATLRNLGLPYCSQDVVAMTDDDALPAGNWVATLRNAHERQPAAGGIGGPVSGLSTSFVSRIADAVVFPRPKPGSSIHTLPTVNMSYKRNVVEEVGDFDESLFRGEDVDYNWRVLRAGYRLEFEAEMRVQHEHRRTLRGLYRQQWMYGRAYYLVRSKWPEMYSVYPHALTSLRDWLKLGHALLAVMYQPWNVSRSLRSSADRIAAYPVLVVHHLVWKLGMVRQALLSDTYQPAERLRPEIRSWKDGSPVAPEPLPVQA